MRDWARVDGDRPAAHRFAARIYEDIGAIDLAEEAAERAAERGPTDAGAWERLGRLRLRLLDREGALQALRRAAELGAGEAVRELIEQALALEPQRGLRGLRSFRSAMLLRPATPRMRVGRVALR